MRPVARTRAALGKLVEFGWLQTRNDKQYELTAAALAELNLGTTSPLTATEPTQPVAVR